MQLFCLSNSSRKSQCLFTIIIMVLLQFSNVSAETKKYHDLNLVRGDITLGGLFALFLRSKENGECSAKFNPIGVKTLLATLFALDRINANKFILPNITLGIRVVNTCGKENVALRMVLKEFVVIQPVAGSHEMSVVGIIGPPTSVESVYIAKVLEIFEIPLFSGIATSPALSDKTKFEYFSRTIPSDIFQIKVLAELLAHFNWSYVSIVYTNEPYGLEGFKKLKEMAKKYGK